MSDIFLQPCPEVVPPQLSEPRTFHFGAAPSQVGDLYLPAVKAAPVVCLLHGGYWRLPHDRLQMHAIALDLVAHGYAVWNLAYRRLGEPGGGWPGHLKTLRPASTTWPS